MSRKARTPRALLDVDRVLAIREKERAWYHRNKAAKTTAELEAERQRKREYDVEYRARLTDEQKKARRQRARAVESTRRATLSAEQRAAIAKKQRDSFWNRSPEERARIRAVAAQKKAEKRKKDAGYRLYTCLQARVHDLLRGCKSERTLALVGSDFMTALTPRLKPGMTWENHGEVWHLDHVVPCRWFDLTRPDHQKACFHHSNINPEFARLNIAKSNRLSRKAFDEVLSRCPEANKKVFDELIWKIRRRAFPERMLSRVRGHV